MAKGMDKLVEVGQSVGTGLLGLVLYQNTAIIPMFPEIVHTIGGVALMVVGVVGIYKKATE